MTRDQLMATKAQRAAKKAQRAIIKAEADRMDCRYRITASGEVHFYGQPIGGGRCCWWRFADSVERAVEWVTAYPTGESAA